MKYDRKILVDNIIELMNKYNITQSDLADIANTHQSRISKCLKCEGDLTLPQLVAIASKFNQSLDSLIGVDTQTDTTKEVTLRIVCEMINLIANMDGVKFIDIQNDEYKDISFKSFLYYKPEYKALYFSNLLYEAPLTYNICNSHINDFIGKMINLLKLKSRNELSQEDYDYLINKHLDALPNASLTDLMLKSINNIDETDDELPFPN